MIPIVDAAQVYARDGSGSHNCHNRQDRCRGALAPECGTGTDVGPSFGGFGGFGGFGPGCPASWVATQPQTPRHWDPPLITIHSPPRPGKHHNQIAPVTNLTQFAHTTPLTTRPTTPQDTLLPRLLSSLNLDDPDDLDTPRKKQTTKQTTQSQTRSPHTAAVMSWAGTSGPGEPQPEGSSS